MHHVIYDRARLDAVLEAVPEAHGIVYRSEVVAGVFIGVWRRWAVPNRAVRYVIQGGFRCVELLDLGHPTVAYGVDRAADPTPLIRGAVSLFLAPRDYPPRPDAREGPQQPRGAIGAVGDDCPDDPIRGSGTEPQRGEGDGAC